MNNTPHENYIAYLRPYNTIFIFLGVGLSIVNTYISRKHFKCSTLKSHMRPKIVMGVPLCVIAFRCVPCRSMENMIPIFTHAVGGIFTPLSNFS